MNDKTSPEGIVRAIQDALDRPIAFHRVFVKLTGSVTAALMLSQAMYWSKRSKSDDDGWFYKTRDQWEEETGLTRREQEFARKALRKFSFWKEERKGVPAQLYYRIDTTALSNELLRLSAQHTSNQKSNDITRLHESAQLDGTKAPIKAGGNVPTSRAESAQHYKGVSEITTETIKTTTPLTPLELGSDPPVEPGGGRVFVEKLLDGTVLHAADPGRIANAAKKFKRRNNEIKIAIDILDRQYQQSTRRIEDPTALVVSALKNGIDIPDGYVPKAQREAEIAAKNEIAKKNAEQLQQAQEAEDKAFKLAEEKLAALSDEDRREVFSRAAKGLPRALQNSKMAIKTEAIKMMIANARAPN